MKLPIYFNGMFVLQHYNNYSHTAMTDSSNCTHQRCNSTEEILPYNNVCNFKIKHTNSTFCRLCIIYKIPELINDNFFPRIVLDKMGIRNLMQDSLNMPKRILLANIKQHVKFEISTYG